jgi:hypothetical protein
MHQPCVIDAQHHDFSTYWGQICPGSESPYKISTAFAALQSTLVGSVPARQRLERGHKDFSFVVVRAGVPVIGCCFILQELAETGRTLGCKGLFVTSEFDANSFSAITNNLEIDIFACLNTHLDELMAKLQPDIVEFFDTMPCGVMSPVSHWLLAAGARPILCPVQVIELSGPDRSLREGLDRQQIESISWGQQRLEFRVLETADDLDSSLYASLMLDCEPCPTGRANNEAGFQEQASNSYYRWLLDGRKAFIVQALSDGKLIASTTFAIANGTAQYIASIVSSKLNSKLVLQSLTWEGIQHARSLGLERVELTSAQLQGSGEESSFAGFGGESQARFKLLLTTKH